MVYAQWPVYALEGAAMNPRSSQRSTLNGQSTVNGCFRVEVIRRAPLRFTRYTIYLDDAVLQETVIIDDADNALTESILVPIYEFIITHGLRRNPVYGTLNGKITYSHATDSQTDATVESPDPPYSIPQNSVDEQRKDAIKRAEQTLDAPATAQEAISLLYQQHHRWTAGGISPDQHAQFVVEWATDNKL